MGDVASLDVVLGAKVSGLLTGLSSAQKELAQTALAAAKISDSFENIDLALIPLQNNLKKFEQALSKSTNPGEVAYLQKSIANLKGSIEGLKSIRPPFESLQKSSSSATLALSNLGRVAQDAPFGFIGIANNLNPLLESFQRLRAESGSNVTALKALGNSLLGVGGIGFALSVVSSLLVVFGDKLFSSSKAANAAKDAFDGLLESTAKEALKLKENFAQITDANIPLENRKKIIEGLRSEYGVYLKNISDEALLTGQAAAAYDLINAAIFKKLQLQALEDKILPFIKEQVNLQFQLNEEIKKGNDLRAFIDATTGAKQSKVQKDNAVAIAASNENLGKQLAIQRQIARVGEDINRIFKSIVPLLQFDDNAIGGVKAKIEKALRESFGTGQIAVFPVKVPMQVDVELDKTHGSLSPAGNSIDRAQIIKDLEEAFGRFEIKLPVDIQGFSIKQLGALGEQIKRIEDINALLIDQFNVQLPNALFRTAKGFKDSLGAANDFLQLQYELDALLKQMVSTLATTFGEELGKIFAGTGSLHSLFANLFNVLGDGIKQFGQALVKYGIELAIVKKALSISSPALAIAGGIALIALGSFVQSKVPKLAAGGIVPPGFPNDSFPALLKSNEAVIPLDRLGDFIPQSTGNDKVIFHKISGNELVLWLAASNKQYRTKY